MIIYISIDLKLLLKKGKQFPWVAPCQCPKCGGIRLWGHGYVTAYFDPFSCVFYLKRYRCPDCRSVFRCRPKGFFKRFQASILDIRTSIVMKVEQRRWNQVFSRNRQIHWYQSLLRHIQAYLTHQWHGDLVMAFDVLTSRGLIPVSRAI